MEKLLLAILSVVSFVIEKICAVLEKIYDHMRRERV